MKSRIPSRGWRLKNAVLASFFDPANKIAQNLEAFSESDWRKALFWLDVSGLALYLLDRLTAVGLQKCLPPSILERLKLNLAQNRERTSALFREAVVISHALKKENISFALLKGFTFPPEVVRDPVLRCQMDIDILVRESDAAAARNVVLGFGYIHDSIKGSEWAFTAGAVRLWVELYGRRTLLADPPGNKFYLFLRRQIHGDTGARRAHWYRSLLPFHWWPVRITHGQAGEHLRARLTRYQIEAGFVLSRLRFHMRTSIPYVLESRRWGRMADAGE